MRLPRVRVTVRGMMMAVAIVAFTLSIYALGLRNGRQAATVTPRETALEFTRALALPSAEEACAVFMLAEMNAKHSSGFLSESMKATAKRRNDQKTWDVHFADRRTGKTAVGVVELSPESVQKFDALLHGG